MGSGGKGKTPILVMCFLFVLLTWVSFLPTIVSVLPVLLGAVLGPYVGISIVMDCWYTMYKTLEDAELILALLSCALCVFWSLPFGLLVCVIAVTIKSARNRVLHIPHTPTTLSHFLHPRPFSSASRSESSSRTRSGMGSSHTPRPAPQSRDAVAHQPNVNVELPSIVEEVEERDASANVELVDEVKPKRKKKKGKAKTKLKNASLSQV